MVELVFELELNSGFVDCRLSQYRFIDVTVSSENVITPMLGKEYLDGEWLVDACCFECDVGDGTRWGSVPRHRQHRVGRPSRTAFSRRVPTGRRREDTNAVFETSVGVIHRVNDRSRFVVHAERGHPQTASGDVSNLVVENLHATVDLDVKQFENRYDTVEEQRFGQTQTEYKDWAVDRLREHHTTTVSYTGDNNVTYTKTCEPKRSDVSVQSIEPVYVPQVRHTTDLGEYAYPYEYFAAGPSRVTTEDGIHRCVHCDAAGTDDDYTYCENCGSINCDSHIRTERLERTPVCTGCAVTERFAFKTKYFYDEENRDAFREDYESMALHEKAMENTPLAVGTAVVLVLFLLGILVSLGGV